MLRTVSQTDMAYLHSSAHHPLTCICYHAPCGYNHNVSWVKKEATMLGMKKALGAYSLANLKDTSGNGAVYIVTMRMALLSLELMMKKCDEADIKECLTQCESKEAKKSRLVAKSSESEILSG